MMSVDRVMIWLIVALVLCRFDIVNHLNIAQHLVTDLALRQRLARLNLILALRCKQATTFTHALRYACFGIIFLGPPGKVLHRPHRDQQAVARSPTQLAQAAASHRPGLPQLSGASLSPFLTPSARLSESLSPLTATDSVEPTSQARRQLRPSSAASAAPAPPVPTPEDESVSESSLSTEGTDGSSVDSDGLLPDDIDYDSLCVPKSFLIGCLFLTPFCR